MVIWDIMVLIVYHTYIVWLNSVVHEKGKWHLWISFNEMFFIKKV